MTLGPEIVGLVRDRADFMRVVGGLVNVRLGVDGRTVGICPFHSDRQGTLELNADLGHYDCIVCHAHGDLFALVQAQRSLTYQ